MDEAKLKPGNRIGARMVPLDDLSPHPLNANVMPGDLRAKLKAHIHRTGRYPFVVVRPHPEEPGRYQVLDGHHRVEILRELGHKEARCDVWQVDDREAKLLLATLNRAALRDLLRDDGVILVSVDDNEVHHLRMLLDEIFGEENRIETIVWKKSYGGGAKSKHFVNLHEYVLCFAKDKNLVPPLELPPDDEILKILQVQGRKVSGAWSLSPPALGDDEHGRPAKPAIPNPLRGTGSVATEAVAMAQRAYYGCPC